MDLIDIKELMITFSESEISDFELEFEGIRIKMGKGLPLPQSEISSSVTPQVPNLVTLESLDQSAKSSAELVAEEINSSSIVEIVSPMIGTFYRAPSPTSDPYVVEGDQIVEGQTLCIIEAMKLMNEFESEYSGKIVKVLVENGQPVEYGEPLFLLEPVE